MMKGPGEIKYFQRGRVRVITLHYPEKRNILTRGMREDFLNILEKTEEEKAIRVLVITGEGKKAFCAGMDLREFYGLRAFAQWERDIDIDRIFERMERFPKPILAMVNGYAFGGGCELALACAFRIACHSAEFGLPEINFNLIPGGGGTQRLARLVGKGQAMRLILSGDRISAEAAERIGLVELLVREAELHDATMAMAERIAEHDPIALRNALEAVRAVDEMPLSGGLRYEALRMGLCLGREEHTSQLDAFFKGKGK